MHPVYNKTNFGKTGTLIQFYNGSAAVNGYILRQIAQTKYIVTDGTVNGSGALNTWTVTLAQTSAQATAIGSTQPTIATIPINTPLSTASGASFTPTYALDTYTAFVAGGTGATSGNSFTIDGGTRAQGSVTITNFANLVASSSTVAIAGTTFTFTSTASSGTSVQIGASNAATATNLYTQLVASGAATCWYYVSGATVTVIAKANGTAANAYALTTNASTGIALSAATLTGGAASVGNTTPSVVTVTASGGNVSAIASVTTAGAWTALPAGNAVAYYNGNAVLPMLVAAAFTIATGTSSIAVSGGTGYAVGDYLTFSGFTDATAPVARISAVTGSAPTTVNVLTAGTGITVAGTIGVDGPVGYVRELYDTQCLTVAGVRTAWTLGSSKFGGSVIPKFS